MRLVNHQVGAGVTTHRKDVAERREITIDRIEALDDDQAIPGACGQARQLTGEEVGRVVPEADDLRTAEANRVVDARMAIHVEHDVVALAAQRPDDREVGLVARAEHGGVTQPVRLCQVVFERPMQRQRAARNPRTRRGGAVPLEGVGGGAHNVGVQCQPEVVVRTEGDGVPPFD